MKNRCRNPKHPAYARYGGRGIKVCNRWKDFSAFLKDMGPRPSPDHSIDRIDNDKDYTPENCRWANILQQSHNRSTNRILEFRGEKKPLIEWARRLGIKKTTIKERLNRGWSTERALSEPPNKGRSKYNGVSPSKNKKRWRATANINGKQKHIGIFDTEEEAHLARQRYLEELA